MRQDLLAQARAAWTARDAARAATLARRHLQTTPADLEAAALLANCGALLADPQLALEGLRPLLRAQPASPPLRRAAADALNMHGARLRAAGLAGAAITALEEATALAPEHPHAWFNLGAARADAGAIAAAIGAVEQHLAGAPADDEARVLLARLLRPGDPQAAAAQLAGLSGDGQLDTALVDAAFAEADALDRDGADAAARTAYAALHVLCGGSRRSPGLRAAIGQRLALPAVSPSTSALLAARARYEQGLAELEADWDRLLASAEPSLDQLAWCNFKLAYQGMDDRFLQERYAALLERAAARLCPQWSTPAPRGGRRRRARIGLVSSGFRQCTVGAYFGGWIGWLRDAGYELRLYQLGIRDALTDRLAARAGHLHHHTAGPDALAATIHADAPDLLLYPDLGMDPRLLPLAALRLAPRQLVGWGHPVTTGLSTLDGFLTCAAMEPPDAADHYREPLLPLPGLGVDYDAPAPPAASARATLGLPEGVPLVLVPQSLFKLHPDFDASLATLAQACPGARLVLFEAPVRAWTRCLQDRLAEAFAAAGASPRQALWLPEQPRERYLAINAACDLMVDAPQWSGGNTALDALLSGLPLLATPGRFMRGRQSSAMVRLMGLGDALDCKDADEMVARAQALLADGDRRRETGAALRAGRARLLEPAPAREALVGHVRRLLAAPAG